MRPETAPPGTSREIRVEGGWLLVLAAVLVVLLAGAFLLGRLSAPAADRAAAKGEAPGAEIPETQSVESKSNRFDSVGAAGIAPEPGRQLASEVPPPSPRAPVAQAAPGGPWVVQVFAGRDRRAAESVVSDLRSRGYPVRLDSQRDGRDALFKVRVGGYGTESEARAVADRLQGEGNSAAWVTRAR